MASGAGDNTPPNENIESSKVEESPAAVSEASSTVANDTNDDSEYETLDEDEEDSSPVVKPSKLRSKESDDEDGIDNVNDDDDEGDGNDDDDDEGTFDSRRLSNSSLEDDLSDDIIIEDERLGGDGQEKEEKKKLDDDMDRRNPQYIPRKSCYFEHDDRSSTSAVSTANSAEAGADSNNTVDRRRKVWSDRAIDDKWTHDKYVEEDQTAKSSQELIDTYGYDIRSEEAPPKARRRRKYGRGPSKYSRNWEDEEAYRGNLSSGDRRRSNNRIVSVENATEFPALADATQNKDRDQRKKPRPRNLDYKGEEHQISKPTKSILKTSNSKQNSEENRQRNNQRQNNENTDDGNAPAKDTSKEHVKFPPVGPVIVPSLPKNVRGRGQFKPGPGKMEFTPTRGRGRIPSGTRMNSGYSALPARPLTDNNQTPDPIMSVTSNMSSLQVTPIPVSSPQETKRPSIMEVQSSGVPSAQPGAVQEQSPSATNRSKRYSAQRQRSLPETSFSSPPPSGPPPTPPQVPPGVLAHDPNAIAAYYSGTAPNAPPPPHVPQATPEYSHPCLTCEEFIINNAIENVWPSQAQLASSSQDELVSSSQDEFSEDDPYFIGDETTESENYEESARDSMDEDQLSWLSMIEEESDWVIEQINRAHDTNDEDDQECCEMHMNTTQIEQNGFVDNVMILPMPVIVQTVCAPPANCIVFVPVPDYPPPNISAGMPTTVNTAMPPPPPPPPQMVAFLPAGPPPPVPPPAPTAPVPPFPPPSMINYVPAPTYPIPIRAPPVQQEVYQGQNGITYYSPQSQAAIPRQTPSRRKKVAIPIVPPPPDQQQQQQQQQGMVPMVMGVVGGVGTPPHIPAQQQMATVAPVVADSNTEA